jgi:hypothetical protein
MASTARSVVPEVRMVRDNVSLTDRFRTSSNPLPFQATRFSRMRSYTMMVSLME